MVTYKPSRSRTAHYRPLALVAALLAAAAGCGGFVEVGEGQQVDDDDDSSAADGGMIKDGGEGQPAPKCEKQDAERRAGYDEWQAAPNDFGDLVGRTYSGYIEGDADVSLVIEQDGSARFIVGEAVAAPTEADKGHLCEETPGLGCTEAVQNPPVDGGTYEIHGASFNGTRLRIPLVDRAPYDAWCALQTPVAHLDDRCFFDLIGGRGVEFGEPGCVVIEEKSGMAIRNAVDCGWFMLAFEGFVCDCTSTECFAAAASAEGQLEIDVHVVHGGFEGSFIDYETRRIYLFEER